MNIRDCQEVACASDLRIFEAHLVHFANDADFRFMTGALILEGTDGSVKSLSFGNIPDAFRLTFESDERGRRDPVMHRLKRLRVPFAYDQSMYVAEGSADVWEAQAEYGFKTGIALTLYSGPGKYFIIGVDRETSLPDEAPKLTRLMADLHLFAAHAQVAAWRLLEPAARCVGELPRLSARELEILKWTGEGKSAWAVGQILNTSEHNVNYHLRAVMTKLAVASKHQAAAKARALGLL
jgi:DNA-binding CsgD family transcriptional regulator